jgi:penicillin amidase
MATTVASPATRGPKWRLAFIIVTGLALVIAVAVAVAFTWLFYKPAHASLAQLDGAISVSGLAGPVSVVRDVHGVPHLAAASLEDLFLAQGYVTAQDRLWQMDMTRRAAAGELAEILGTAPLPGARTPSRSNAAPLPDPTFVDYDKTQRILRLRAVAERVAEQLSERDRMIFAAYARGVNAYLAEHRNNLPIEFRIMRYQPRAWTAADSVLVGIAMSQLLNPQYDMEYWREKIGQILSPELMADLYPASSSRDHAPGDDNALPAGKPPAQAPGTRKASREQVSKISSRSNELYPTAAQAAVSLALYGTTGSGAPTPRALTQGAILKRVLETFGSRLAGSSVPGNDCESCVPGSNNWVVSGAHTTTGKPLLSNDMHLPHRLPAVWYELQLHYGDFNVEGFSLPGLPLVVVGHNQHIAWGFTNLNPDVQDLFVENFNDASEYQTLTGWQKPETYHEVIRVRYHPDVDLDVVVTRHGPIISDLFPGEKRKLALEWLVYDTRNVGIPLFDLDAAQNWDQFRKALSVFATPSQNVVYGDVDGNIGYQAMGFVPLRVSGDGTTPVSGADGKHDWTGYLPFNQMPSVYNPPSGIIATANSKITPDGYPHLLATQWYPPYRTERIYHVLESGKKFAPADMLALQADITSEYDRFFADHFVNAVDHSSKAGARAKQAADIMRGFDGRMTPESAAATIEVKAGTALWQLLLEPKLGAEWEHYQWSEKAVALENIVRNEPDRWLPPGYGNFNDLLTAAVEAAVKDAPSDLESWEYGKAFPLEINHTVLAAVPGLSHWAGPGRQPQSGGSYTVKQVGRTFGPSERMTVDFSNLDGSTFNIVIGESGQVFSPYYMDHWPAWYGNTTFTLAYSDAAVQGTKAHELTLEPK